MNNGRRRVVITGVGAVTPIGTAADGLWQGLTARRAAGRGITRFGPTPFKSRIAAEIPDFRPQDHLNAKRAKRLDRFSQLAVTSARLALADAELDPGREDGDRVGAMMGSALGGVAFAEAQVGSFLTQGPRGLDPALALAVFPGAASCNIAIEFGFTGPNSTNAMSCASGTIAVGDVGYVNAHGSSTLLNDATETQALKQVFGPHAYRLSISGTKGYYGHALGASGAIEAAICALAMQRRWLPPTINLERPDPACDLDCLPGEGRAAAPEVVVSNSFGFGGINASLVLRRV